jgi:AcrR family transcriptional regulator
VAEQIPKAGREPVEDKARQILDGAHMVFMRDGFDAASMNEIAKAAGVSKGTLYVYFDSKETLFEALIKDEKRRQAERIFDLEVADGDVASVLTRWGEALIAVMSSPAVVAQVRTVMAVAPKFRRLGRAFYESGPVHGVTRLSAYLKGQADAGLIEAPDPHRAAVDFIQLCQGDIYKELLFCAVDDISEARIAENIRAAVATFMRAYGPSR